LRQDLGPNAGRRFLPDARLNFAENLLRPDDDALAILPAQSPPMIGTFLIATWLGLFSRRQGPLARAGVTPGDRWPG
jgi:acetoacetyl-CoA synthetase